MELKVMLDPGVRMPERAHDTDAGMDLFSPEAVVIPAGGSAVINTGVHLGIPDGWCGLLVSKSGLNVKHGITSTGLIDASYTGAIIAKLYNNSDEDYTVELGDKITQIVLLPFAAPKLVQVGSLDKTERGDEGFGSTGR